MNFSTHFLPFKNETGLSVSRAYIAVHSEHFIIFPSPIAFGNRHPLLKKLTDKLNV